MRLLRPLILVLLASGLLTAQNTSNTSSASEDASVATELKALRQALADQQNEITRQQQELEQLRKQVSIREASGAGASAQLVNASLNGNAGVNPATDAPRFHPRRIPGF